jgi:pyruvate/2-oxoglutarate dehydrogenase complex dihydrolipoamide dehydrogenase (E3) component
LTTELAPLDEHNQLLLSHVHPHDWINPTPNERYNLIAVGGGTAGIVAALGAAGLGGRAALVEQRLLGGDCLNHGCVPSKALVSAARAAYQVSQAGRFGVRHAAPPEVDFACVMERMRRLRAQIGQHDSAARLHALAIDVFLGQARFTDANTLEVGGQTLRFRRAVIATGSRPAAPDVPGLAEAGYLTNETIFSLTQLPRRLIVIGGGPIGCELGQAFRRFGSEVHLVQRGDRLLAKEDEPAGRLVREQLQREGMHLYFGHSLTAVELVGDSKCLIIERGGEKRKLIADAILVATGRRPIVEGLNLEAAGVRYDAKGIEVDDHLRTSNRAVFAAGDVCSAYKFTHAADAMARLVVQNALFLGRRRFSSLVIPCCTYTDPEVAHVGYTATEASERGIEIDTYRVELAEVDRAVIDGDEQGFAAVHTRRGTGRVVGATIVAPHAGEMIGEITLLMANRLTLAALGRTIHCYPTQVEVLKKIADAYQRSRLTPLISAISRKWLAWFR